jgi:hypothetical protein
LVSLEEVASEGTGEDGGSEAAFKESGSIKLETMSCEDESGKSNSSEWKFGGDSAHGRVTIPDQYAPPIFTGKPSEDAEKWVSYFRRFTACQGWTEEQARRFFPLCLKGKTFDWYKNQEDELKYALHDLLDGFMTYFSPTPLDRMLEADNVFNRTQREEETVRGYVQTMITLSKRVENVDPKTLRFLVIKGFRPHIKGYILQHQEQCKTLDDLVKFGSVAEATAVDSTREASNFTRQMEDNFKALSAKLDNLSRERADRPAQSVRFQDTGRRPTSSHHSGDLRATGVIEHDRAPVGVAQRRRDSRMRATNRRSVSQVRALGSAELTAVGATGVRRLEGCADGVTVPITFRSCVVRRRAHNKDAHLPAK